MVAKEVGHEPGVRLTDLPVAPEGGSQRFSRILSAGAVGMMSTPVEVEVMIRRDPKDSFVLTGLPGRESNEAKERVEAALQTNGFKRPEGKITVNLWPANLSKNWTGYDLPMAAAILSADRQMPRLSSDTLILGELSLDGRVNPVTGVLPIAFLAKLKGYSRIIVPAANFEEASFISLIDAHSSIEIIPVRSLHEVVQFANGQKIKKGELPAAKNFSPPEGVDFSDIKGQEHIKRAFEVAVAGGHNVLMFGDPGTGKTMIAEALPGIMPPLSDSELLEVLQIESLRGEFSRDVMMTRRRPFRSPHHGMSLEAMTGSADGPGELSLAHRGVLFMDEFSFFKSNVIEALRGPLTTGHVRVARKSGVYEYPASTMVVAALNPGKRISAPILDRMDMILQVSGVSYQTLGDERRGEPSVVIRQRVIAARAIQRARFNGSGTTCNAEMSAAQVEKFCKLDGTMWTKLNSAATQMNLTPRTYHKMLKIARTIADLDGSENIRFKHLVEALDWRHSDDMLKK